VGTVPIMDIVLAIHFIFEIIVNLQVALVFIRIIPWFVLEMEIVLLIKIVIVKLVLLEFNVNFLFVI
jgi:hypothetical protein